MRIYYLGKPGDGYGWGVANSNLVRELSKLCEVVVDTSNRTKFDAPVFVPVPDHTLSPPRRIRAPYVMGYCFTEWPLGRNARINAQQYDVMFAGSAWNVQRLAQAGIEAHPLIQGVDFERFAPAQPSERKGFVVFSGGKFEYRKGQDIAIAAMRRFMQIHGDAVLMTAWHNPWPQSALTMANSPHLDIKDPLADIPPDRIITLPAIPNEKIRSIYEQAHLGIFPNRCEAGTNLVMCEFMACSRPVIASLATGQRDVLAGDGPYHLKNGSYDPAGWFNPNVSDVLAHLEHAYQNRQELTVRGMQCRALVSKFTWKACAETIYSKACEGINHRNGVLRQPVHA